MEISGNKSPLSAAETSARSAHWKDNTNEHRDMPKSKSEKEIETQSMPCWFRVWIRVCGAVCGAIWSMSTQHNYYLSSSVQNPKLVARSVPTHTHTHSYAHNRRWQAHRRHIVNCKGKCNEWRRRDTRRNERRLCTQRNPNKITEHSIQLNPREHPRPATSPSPSPLAGCVWALRLRRHSQCWQNSLERTDWELEPLKHTLD